MDMTPTALTWTARHDAIVAALSSPKVSKAINDLRILRKGIHPTFHCDKNQDSDSDDSPDHLNSRSQDVIPKTSAKLGEQLDLALTILWSSQGLDIARDPNPFRSIAIPQLKAMFASCLGIDDFRSVKTLQKSSGSLVEVVQCKLDRRFYVLKTCVKGFVKRNSAIQSPIFEARLLRNKPKLSTQDIHRDITPELYAAFQTQGSVHILMEYIPSGDFSEMLIAASKCGPEYPGRASTGLLTQGWILRYGVDMVLAISWVHSRGYAHRDIKPGNFLLDKTGHLKLCDFSSAAPFSHFQVSEPLLDGRVVWSRKVHQFYCTLPIGTCDYLSPELLEAEELRIAEKQRHFQSLGFEDLPWAKPVSASSTPTDEEPGSYGPELDWWSLGIMLYEMRYGVLPFFASSMGATYELIKDHENTLKFDESVQCSNTLQSIIRQLLSVAVRRLGSTSSQEVQAHEFFKGVDWTKPWPLDPPFVPRTTDNLKAAADGLQSLDQSHTVSPRAGLGGFGIDAHVSLSVVETLPSFSALYAGDPDDFPAFVDSREVEDQQSYLWKASGDIGLQTDASATHVGSIHSGLMPRSTSSPAIVDNYSSPSPFRTKNMEISPSLAARNAPRWSDCDTWFIGLSRLPTPNVFTPSSQEAPSCQLAEVEERVEEEEEEEETVTNVMSAAPSLGDLTLNLDQEFSPGAWQSSGPIASTPYSKLTAGGGAVPEALSMPTPPSFMGTPAIIASARKPLHQVALIESLVKANRPVHGQSFVTPAKKPSYVGLNSRFRNQHSTLPEDTPAQFGDQLTTPAVPQSPYPFPLASVPPSSKLETKSKPLRRNDLARTRSATPGAGSVGSDSRQSGGSNAVREISEREAWDEMMAAVQKSVRKKQKEELLFPTANQTRPPQRGIPHSLTDPALSTRKTHIRLDKLEQIASRLVRPSRLTRAEVPEISLSRTTVGSTQSEQIDRILRKEPSKTIVAPSVKPMGNELVAVTSYDSDSLSNSSDEESTWYSGRSAQAMYDVPEKPIRRPGKLNHKKSTRQLLIKAQERTTPTRPNRTQSPSMTEAFSGKHDGRRLPSGILTSEAAPIPSFLETSTTIKSRPIPSVILPDRSSSFSSSNLSTETLSSSGGKIGQVPLFGAIPLLEINSNASETVGLSPNAAEGARPRALRRKQSAEMLSEYRLGIGRTTSMVVLNSVNPSLSPPPDDAFLDDHVTVGAGNHLDPNQTNGKPRRRFSSAILGKHGGGSNNLDTAEDGKICHTLATPNESSFNNGARPMNLASVKGLVKRRQRMTSQPLHEDPSELMEEEQNRKPVSLNGKDNNTVPSTIVISLPTDSTPSRLSTRPQHRSDPIVPSIRVLGQSNQQHTLPSSFSTTAILDSVPKMATLPARPSSSPGVSTNPDSKAKVNNGTGSVRLLSAKSSHRQLPSQSTENDSRIDLAATAEGDVSLMSGFGQRHSALQGSLFGLEQRLAKLKAKLED